MGPNTHRKSRTGREGENKVQKVPDEQNNWEGKWCKNVGQNTVEKVGRQTKCSSKDTEVDTTAVRVVLGRNQVTNQTQQDHQEGEIDQTQNVIS